MVVGLDLVIQKETDVRDEIDNVKMTCLVGPVNNCDEKEIPLIKVKCPAFQCSFNINGWCGQALD